MDDNATTLLRDGYPWNDPNANRAIQARNPGAPRLVGYTFEQNSLGGINGQARHAANAEAGNATLFGGNPHMFTFDENSRGGKLGGKRPRTAGGTPTDANIANFQCPKCGRLFFYANARAKTSDARPRGEKHRHFRCEGGKAQVLVPYVAH
jgi:hypothetical protein